MNGKDLLGNLKFYDSYSKYNEKLGRKEGWEESCIDVMSMHYNKFSGNKKLKPFIDKALKTYIDKKVLASQRNLQYREEQIIRSNARLFNCASTYVDRPEVFKEAMWVLLNGCGIGYSVENRFIKKLPRLKKRSANVINYTIEDSIEGWSLAVDTLMNSFFNGSDRIRFDGSKIRPKGAFISGGFKAPGYEPLRKSLELIEFLLENKINNKDFKLTSLDAHEIICMTSEAVLSAGVRRSAIICLFDKDDMLMLSCKTGDWRETKPWLERANNSVKLLKGSLSKEEFHEYKIFIKEFGEPGVVLVDDMRFCTNPCCEIGFIPINPRTGNTCISFCNLNEINGVLCKTEEEFYESCENAAVLGTLQASYTNMPFLGKDTEELMRLEALLGVSITGIMDNPSILLNPEILQKGAEIVKQTNELIAELIGINPAARTTTIKPSGNSSVLLGTSSGIHNAHSRRYFRIMQMSKSSEMAKILLETNPVMVEESVSSFTNTDYVVYIPIEEGPDVITKKQITDIEFLKAVSLVYNNWVKPGANIDRGYSNCITHNVSNTVTVQDWDKVFDYIYDNQESFCGLSFMPEYGDKVYKQAPFTEVLNFEELSEEFGEGVMFASGLIVDALHVFNNDLWDACSAAKDLTFKLVGTRQEVLLQRDIIRRIKKYSKNFFKGKIDRAIDCLKNVFIYHKYIEVKREMKAIDFENIKMLPTYTDVSTTTGVACSGGACEITRI